MKQLIRALKQQRAVWNYHCRVRTVGVKGHEQREWLVPRSSSSAACSSAHCEGSQEKADEMITANATAAVQ